MSKLKISNEESIKNFDNCVNYEICKGKWYKYRAKEDNGFCKACIKNDKIKELGIKVNKYRN
jgi:hypothetical protein